MLSSFRNRFGIPGVISVIALVFAMLGGAYAASSNDNGKATASAKGKPGPRGPRGKTGPAGPAGPQGPAGASGKDGSNGLDGENGKDGKNGENGKNGTSVKNEVEPAGEHCAEGGTKLVGTSTTYACNGKAGEDGEDGETGFTETLPVGKTETGTWSFGNLTPEQAPTHPSVPEIVALFNYPFFVPISFSIPLAAEISETNVHFLEAGDSPTEDCPGSAADPEAKSGHLCVYTGKQSPKLNEETLEGTFLFNAIVGPETGESGAGRAGALLRFLIVEKGAFAFGSWAVTA